MNEAYFKVFVAVCMVIITCETTFTASRVGQEWWMLFVAMSSAAVVGMCMLVIYHSKQEVG
jgi:hypothetical protein